MELLKFKFDLTWSCQNDPWYIVNAKNFRIQETPNLSTDADRSPDTKIELFWGGEVHMDIRRYGHKDVHTEGEMGGRDTFHMSRYHLSHVSEVQCNSTLQYSAVQHCSRLVHKKFTKSNLKKKFKVWRFKFLQQELEVKKTAQKKDCHLMCKFWPIYGNFRV